MAKREKGQSENFFTQILSKLFKSTDPEAEKKRQLKAIAKEISHSKYKFIKVSSGEVYPALAKWFHEIYKAIGPAQSMIQSVKNPNAFKNIAIDAAMTDKQRNIADLLTEESILEKSKNTDVQKLKEEIKSNMSALLSDFTTEKIQMVDRLYTKVMYFNAFCTYDFYFLLKKFDSTLQERDFNYIPKFESIRGEYILDDLKDFIAVTYSFPFDEDWKSVIDLLKVMRGVDPIAYGVWQKLMIRLNEIIKSDIFVKIIQVVSKDPNYVPTVYQKQEHVFEAFLDKLKTQTELTLLKVEQQKKTNKIDQLLTNIFGTTVVLRLKNYTEAASTQYERKMLPGFAFHQPLNYLKAFLIDYLKKNIREYTDLILVRGKWSTAALSNQFSDIYHSLLTVSDQLVEFDENLSEDKPIGQKLKNLLLRCDRDKDSLRILRTLLKENNDKAAGLMTNASQNLIVYARTIKALLEDKEKPTSQMIINWKELDHFSENSVKSTGVAIYKMIYQFITLMQFFIQKEE